MQHKDGATIVPTNHRCAHIIRQALLGISRPGEILAIMRTRTCQLPDGSSAAYRLEMSAGSARVGVDMSAHHPSHDDAVLVRAAVARLVALHRAGLIGVDRVDPKDILWLAEEIFEGRGVALTVLHCTKTNAPRMVVCLGRDPAHRTWFSLADCPTAEVERTVKFLTNRINRCRLALSRLARIGDETTGTAK